MPEDVLAIERKDAGAGPELAFRAREQGLPAVKEHLVLQGKEISGETLGKAQTGMEAADPELVLSTQNQPVPISLRSRCWEGLS